MNGNVTTQDMLELGLHFVGYDWATIAKTCHATNMRRFLAHYGSHPETLADLFSVLKTTTVQEAKLAKPDIKYFLLTVHWLKTYDTNEVLASRWQLDESTIRYSVKKYIGAIQALKAVKVSTLLVGLIIAQAVSHTPTCASTDCLESGC